METKIISLSAPSSSNTPSGKGGPALGDRALLAIAASQRQMGIAELIAAMSFPTAVTIDVIVIYLVVTILATNLYTNWCKKQLVMQAKP